MPLYEYRCPAGCAGVVELRMSASLRDLEWRCGRCDAPLLRVITPPAAIHVAGGTNAGWLRRG